MIKVKIKKLCKEAKVPFKTYLKDFCYDCVATSCEEVAPNVYKYGLGLAFEIDRGDFLKGLNMSIDFRPRSSVWKTGMVLMDMAAPVSKIT